MLEIKYELESKGILKEQHFMRVARTRLIKDQGNRLLPGDFKKQI